MGAGHHKDIPMISSLELSALPAPTSIPHSPERQERLEMELITHIAYMNLHKNPKIQGLESF